MASGADVEAPKFCWAMKVKHDHIRADPASPKARPAKHRGFSLALRPTRSLSAMGVPEEGNWCSIACCGSPEGRCSYTFWPRQFGATEESRCSSDGAKLHAGKQTGQTVKFCVGDCEGRQHRRKAPSKVIGVAARPALLRRSRLRRASTVKPSLPSADGLGDVLPEAPKPSPPSMTYLYS